MENAYAIRMYIGRRYGGKSAYAGQIIPREFFRKIVTYAETNIACVVLDENGRIQGGTTRYSAKGQWEGIGEDTTIIETWATHQDYSVVLERVRETAQFVGAALEQDAVAITVQPIYVEFVWA